MHLYNLQGKVELEFSIQNEL